ncbi:hypothetical protein GGR34_000139 [Microvirga flocculans]|uniref:Uncharacterized protein n=1 Tax=Microvirga flocculans TaxID=217168 RepID=A0A7W6IBT3_9HYPH|nr:hypothetical protein [Microvirga flocculans]MBB4038510.1 hypothetical protein [Microvirga flocculans]
MSTRPDNPDRADIPPARTIEPMEASPLAQGSTSAQLKDDIDSGRTGDKNEVFDPALSPLGTDDEAGGYSPKPEQVDQARHQETSVRWQDSAEKDSYAHGHSRKALYGYIGFIGLVLVLLVGAFSMV